VPSGNTLFLVCGPCCDANEADFGIKLATRNQMDWYQHEVPTKQFDAWLANHRKCGPRGMPDHFKLAHLYAQNHDQMPAPKLLNAAMQELDS
jgi:hypothetical protein